MQTEAEIPEDAMPDSSGAGAPPFDPSLIVRIFGMQARRVSAGFFINKGGDDLMLVRMNGEIIPYAHDANAFLVASRVAAALSKTTS